MTRLLWANIAPHHDLHTAFIDIPTARGYVMPRHCHDFYELILVLSGRAAHDVDGDTTLLEPNQLMLVRPDDAHTIRVARGTHLQYINIAFRADLWRTFSALGNFGALEEGTVPHCMVKHEVGSVRRCFENLLEPQTRTRSGLLRLLSETAPLLIGESTVEFDRTFSDAPDWLQRACAAMRVEENLRGGVPRLVELCGASAGHVSRTLKAHSGLAPSEWILERKLERAASLLSTSQRSIEEIARDCGFQNASYFYRTFARRYKMAPRAFRLRASRAVTAHL
ncbi:MAG TPA: AraC family transcriptional regulator [Abditibacteriaceae bacterium]|jgi:AraC-like DNA-binding protein/mannose-6-phosphate isomerase-like protein (cupin superfamily)